VTYPKKLIKIVAKLTRQIAQTPFMYKEAEFLDNRVATLGHFSLFYKVSKMKY